MIHVLVLPDGRQTEVEVDADGVIMNAEDEEVVMAAVVHGIAYVEYDRQNDCYRTKLRHVQLAFDLSQVEAEEMVKYA